jgi:V/A-type H+/Na+-transporting ATPase subunit A
VKEYVAKNIHPTGLDEVVNARDILLRGKEAQEQINILGDDGVPLDYHKILEIGGDRFHYSSAGCV